MKKIICTLLLLSFAFSLLCACNDPSATTDAQPSESTSGVDAMSLLPVPEESVFWYPLDVITDDEVYFAGMQGSGTLHAIEGVSDEAYIAFGVAFIQGSNDRYSESTRAGWKALLEAEGLAPVESKNEKYFFCFATKKQMENLSDPLKGRLWIEVSTKESFVNSAKCEK